VCEKNVKKAEFLGKKRPNINEGLVCIKSEDKERRMRCYLKTVMRKWENKAKEDYGVYCESKMKAIVDMKETLKGYDNDA
jgi:hypothetical protein